MQLNLQTFTSYVRQFAATAQASAGVALDFTIGAALRVIAEANASIALWLQWIAWRVLQTTRLSTSTGPDVDSWMQDFGLGRFPGSAATGTVTFSRFIANTQAVVFPGAQVKTADGTQTFVVIADLQQPSWNATQGGYVMSIAAFSVNATVQALVSGTGANVQPNTVTLLASAIQGIDTVTNPAAFSTGVDPETDDALKARFVLYIAGLSKGTPVAVESAVANVQAGLRYAIIEDNPTSGAFTVVVDDGSGNPPSSLISAVFAAVDRVRPIGVTFNVAAPKITTANISCVLSTAPGVLKSSVLGPVATAIQNFGNSLPIGAVLSYTRLAQVIYDAVPGQLTNVTGLTINSTASDLNPGTFGAIKVGTVSVA